MDVKPRLFAKHLVDRGGRFLACPPQAALLSAAYMVVLCSFLAFIASCSLPVTPTPSYRPPHTCPAPPSPQVA